MGDPESLLANKGRLFQLLHGDRESAGIQELAIEKKTAPKVEAVEVSAVKVMTVEERKIGGISGAVLKSYAKAAGGSAFLIQFFGSLVLMQLARIATDIWLTIWTSISASSDQDGNYLGIYGALAVIQMIFIVVFALLVAKGGTEGAKNLHNDALSGVLKAPLSFFETNPLGRIINRFSKDQDQVDNMLIDSFRLFIMVMLCYLII
jgi:ABC-type multidrug transport system fused ATPase/permease subunit